MTQLQFSAIAVSDLKRLRDFIAIHNPEAAAKTSLRIRQAIAKLVTLPAIGRPVPELESVRELVVGKYVVRYTYSEEKDLIIILRIWHGKEFRSE